MKTLNTLLGFLLLMKQTIEMKVNSMKTLMALVFLLTLFSLMPLSRAFSTLMETSY